MKIAKNYDVVNNTPDASKGTNPFDNPGIMPNKSIPDCPGEKATNDPAALSTNKGQPFGKGGSGYTKGS